MRKQVVSDLYGRLPEVFVFSIEQSKDNIKLEFFDNVVKKYFRSFAHSDSSSSEIYFKLFDSYQRELFLKKLNHSIKNRHQVEHYLTFSSDSESEISLMLVADLVSLTDTTANWTGYMRVLSDEIKSQEQDFQKKAFFYLAENSEDLILLFDKNGLVTYCNSALCKFVNKKYEKIIGKAASELNLGQQSLFLESMLRDILHQNGEVDLSFQVVLTPAKDKYVEAFVRLSPICQISGKYDAALMIVKLDSEVEHIKHEYEILLDNIPDALVKLNTLGQITYVSKSILDSSKKPLKDYLYKTPVELNFSGIEESDSKLLSSALDCMRVGERTNIISEFRCDNGVRVLDILHVPIQDRQKGVIGALCVSRDITLLKKLEAELKFEGYKFQTLADNSPDKIVRYDLNFNRVYVNRSFLELYGVEYSDVLATPINDSNWTATNLSVDEFKKILETIVLTQVLQHVEINIQNIKTGGLRVIALTVVPEINEHHGVISLLAVGRDITELKTSERMLKESKEQLIALSAKRELDLEAEKRRIAREIHDELGQLLSLTRLNVASIDFQIGDDFPPIKEQCLRTILIIDRAISSMRKLAFQLRPDVLDSGIVSALEWLILDFSNNTGINCRLQIPDKNISLEDNQSSFIFRIVQESLTNILRHAQAKNVLVDVVRSSNEFMLAVTDDGVGFQFGDQTFYKSTGIQGMRERAFALGGTLQILTKEGMGTSVIFSLPLVRR